MSCPRGAHHLEALVLADQQQKRILVDHQQEQDLMEQQEEQVVEA